MNKKFIFILAFLSVIFYSGEHMARADDKFNGNPFGVLEFLHWNHSWNSYHYPDEAAINKAIALMKEAGVGIVRMDFIWQDIEPVQGKTDYSKYDKIVDLLCKNKIKILGILDYTADWASPVGKWNHPSDDNSMFVKYATAVVKRYKDRIKYWEIWNEPDSHTYWEPQDGLKQYHELLKDTYTAIKKADPDALVLNGGLAGGLSSVNRLYDNGSRDYFDILNVHIFETPLDKIAIKRAVSFLNATRKVMSRNGDCFKKIWVTEIGCPGVKRGLEVKNWWMGKNPSEQDQARWVKQVFDQLLVLDSVEKIFWAFFRDTNNHWGNAVDNFGLLRNDFSKKPAFDFYKQASKKWNNN